MRFLAVAEQPFDGLHRAHQTPLGGGGQAAQQRGHLVVRARVEGREDLASLGREGEVALPTVGRGAGLEHEPAPLEAAQNAAQVSRIEAEITAQRRRGGLVAVRELVQDPHLREGERALVRPLA